MDVIRGLDKPAHKLILIKTEANGRKVLYGTNFIHWLSFLLYQIFV